MYNSLITIRKPEIVDQSSLCGTEAEFVNPLKAMDPKNLRPCMCVLAGLRKEKLLVDIENILYREFSPESKSCDQWPAFIAGLEERFKTTGLVSQKVAHAAVEGFVEWAMGHQQKWEWRRTEPMPPRKGSLSSKS
jgi:hypothetical protein